MKILHIIQTMSERFGGPVILLKALARHQVNAGDDVTICTTNVDFPKGILKVPSGKPAIEGGVKIWFHSVQFRPLLVSIPLMQWIQRHLTEFDVVHIIGLYRFPVSYAAWSCRKAGVPYIIAPQGALDPYLYRQSQYNLLLKRMYEKLVDIPNLNGASAIHFTAQGEANRASFLKLIAPKKIVPNGIDWNHFRRLPPKGGFRMAIGVAEHTPLVLYLGRINFKKGIDLLISAFADICRELPAARLAIVGPDNEGYGRQVLRWCRQYGIQKQVYMVDYLNYEQVRQAYVDADVFTLPSYTENFGMAVVEAMACACPVVISTEVNIWPDVAGADAGLVTPLDPKAIARAIASLLSDKTAASRVGAAGRKLAHDRYAYERVVEQIGQMYRDILNSRHKAFSSN